jgi:hypothetical protein
MSTDPSDELASYPAATSQASKETPWIATPRVLRLSYLTKYVFLLLINVLVDVVAVVDVVVVAVVDAAVVAVDVVLSSVQLLISR